MNIQLSISNLKILFFSFLIVQSFATAECVETKEKLLTLQNKIDTLFDHGQREFNGCVLVTQGENLIYERCAGSYGQPTIKSQFLIGSISKQFTSVVILQLVDQGLIDIDQPIKKYLPYLLDEWAEIVTVKHLLSHTSGVKKIGEPLEFQPGTQFKYSPIFAYYLCSQIAEAVTGTRFEQLLSQLFGLTEMKNTGIIYHNDPTICKPTHPFLIQGFKESDDRTLDEVKCFGEGAGIYNDTWIAGGGIVSTIQDLAQWNRKLHKGHILREETYNQMITPFATRKHPRYGAIAYGLGVQLVKQKNLEVSHSGYLDGFTSTLIYYPNTEISVVILENISLSTGDIKRAFSLHDALRDFIRTLDYTEGDLRTGLCKI